jgi:hypothetical protein
MAAIQQLLFAGEPPDFVELTDRYISDLVFVPDTAFAAVRFENDGKLYRKQGTNAVEVTGEWATQAVAGADYEVRAVLSSGDTPSGPALNTWHSIGTSREWSLTRTPIGIRTCVLAIEIRLAATSQVQGAASITLEAIVEI